VHVPRSREQQPTAGSPVGGLPLVGGGLGGLDGMGGVGSGLVGAGVTLEVGEFVKSIGGFQVPS